MEGIVGKQEQSPQINHEIKQNLSEETLIFLKVLQNDSFNFILFFNYKSMLINLRPVLQCHTFSW